MSDLVMWLRAQLDEDERIAEAASLNSETWAADSSWLKDLTDPLPSQRRALPGAWPPIEVAETNHIARHDPARVLAEVEAKRRIIDLCAARSRERAEWFAPEDSGISSAEVDALWTVVEVLALPYANRPGYRSEWAP